MSLSKGGWQQPADSVFIVVVCLCDHQKQWLSCQFEAGKNLLSQTMLANSNLLAR
uniref:Uncharacterized protein n=1 Tax=Parascaris equorum TaxID=6256 RepID=A0A914RHG1_PAREQ